MNPHSRCIFLFAGVLAGSLSAPPAAAQSSTPVLRRQAGPMRSATIDLATGTVTRGPRVQDRAASTVLDFNNNDLGGFVAVDTGGGFCEWFEAGVKGYAGNTSDLMSSIVFGYCSSKLSPSSGGPGGATKLGFYEGYVTGGGTPTTAVAVFTLTGLPGNTRSSSFFGSSRCYFVRVTFGDLLPFADGPIGYSWKFLDTGTGVIDPRGAVLAGTWPYLACVASCSAGAPIPDGQGMDPCIDRYCPPGTLLSCFQFGTTSGMVGISMGIQEAADAPATVSTVNSASFPNPDLLASDLAIVGRPWSASLTLGLGRSMPSSWVLLFGSALVNPPDGVPIPSGALNFGSGKAGRMLLCSPSPGGHTVTTAHSGVAGSTSTSAPATIPPRLALVCRDWCAQAVVLGPVPGDGNARLSSAVSGTVGSTP